MWPGDPVYDYITRRMLLGSKDRYIREFENVEFLENE